MNLPIGDLTIAQAAAESGYSVTTINRAIASGALVTVKRGSRRLIPPQALAAWRRARNELVDEQQPAIA